MYTPTSGDELWGLTQSSATVDKGKYIQEAVLQNPSCSSEQNILYADAGEVNFEDDSEMIDEFFEDEVNKYFNDDADVIGCNENGTGETSDGGNGIKNKPEEETGSSSSSNMKLDISFESLLMEHGMMVSPE